MKRTIGFFVAALMGGIASVGLYKLSETEPSLPAAVVQPTAAIQPVDAAPMLTGTVPRVVTSSVDFVEAASKTLDGVVHVKTKYAARASQNYDPFFDFFFRERAPQQQATASGSGVIISRDGYIVTNNHVINQADEVEVTLNDNQTYPASVIGTDPNTDLALLKVDATNLPHVPYGNSDDVQVGEWVVAVGNPFNLTSTVTAGIISAKGRDINILDRNNNGLPAIESFLQTDAVVNPGNSGGALVNTNGDLVGINTAIKTNTGSYTGYSFAIPVNIVKKVVNDLVEFGAVQRGFIGVQIRNIDARLAEEENIDITSGVYVAGLMEGGAAADAGITAGDIITKVGNQYVKDVPSLQEQIGKFRPGDQVNITLKRSGKTEVLPVTLRNQFGKTEVVKKERAEKMALLGAQFREVNDQEKEQLGIDYGLKVTGLESGKLRSAGISEGFVVTRIDKKPVRDFEDISKALEDKEGGVLIEGVYPNGKRAYYGFGL